MYISIKTAKDFGLTHWDVLLDGMVVAQAWSELGAMAIAQRLRIKLNKAGV
jgi:hypothetical protein